MIDRAIPYGKQNITQDDINAVVDALGHDFLTQGPAVAAFEQAFAQYVGSKYAVACANGTAALHLCTLALDVNIGQKVITSPITFAASANCVRYCGGTVDFVDIDPDTYLLDYNKVKEKIEAAPKGTYSGIIPVDFAGRAVNLEKFRQLADEHGLWIIEDACHAPGGYFTDSNQQKQHCGNGNYADLAIFSFHPVKHIACGEGGMVTTNNQALYEKLLMLRTHGITKNPDLMLKNEGGWYYEMQTLGYNYRIPDMLCALGLSQLQRADEGLAKRKAIAKKYDLAFANSNIKVITPPEDNGHAYHLYIIEVENRSLVYDTLRSQNIFAQVHYVPVHLHPYYQELGWRTGDFELSETYYSKALSIPMYPTLTEQEQDYVIKVLINTCNG
jgi:UDP-4-amino-4,6-dideoxy-N-acetyl-beta-L-altrosamine transaminase